MHKRGDRPAGATVRKPFMICSDHATTQIHSRQRSSDDMAVIVAILCVSAFAGWVMAYQLLLQNGRMLARMKRLERRLDIPEAESEDLFVTGLPVGSLLNDFELPALSGGTRTLSSWRGRKLVLIFVSPRCSFCLRMLPQLAALDPSDSSDRPVPVIISTGDVDENRRLFEEHRVRLPVLLQEEAELATLYRVNGTPMGYLIDEHGATETPLVPGAKALLDLIHRSSAAANTGTSKSLSRSRLVRNGLKAGTRAPDFALPQLDGTVLRLDSYRGSTVLLVFSDPNCGPCMELAPEIQKLHAERRDLQVIMISRGNVSANREKLARHGLTFPIVLQRHWEVSRDYGMFATPIAYLIDHEGVLASDVAVGADAILRLASNAEARKKVTRDATTVGL
jgi:peroxiredoxin